MSAITKDDLETLARIDQVHARKAIDHSTTEEVYGSDAEGQAVVEREEKDMCCVRRIKPSMRRNGVVDRTASGGI